MKHYTGLLIIALLFITGCNRVPDTSDVNRIQNYLQGSWKVDEDNVTHRFEIQGNTLRYWSHMTHGEPTFTSAFAISDVYPNYRDRLDARELMLGAEANPMFPPGSLIFVGNTGLFYQNYKLEKIN